MHCPSCDAPVTATQKFCAECGASLVITCANCGTVNPPGNKFCPECGTPVGSAPTTPGAPAATGPGTPERRFVSVLFADLVGFTPFSESRDPEDVRSMLTEYFDRSRQIIERYSGAVDKFIGDAVMAVWGAVEAHEDDAERAVRAALELVDSVAELGTSIGVPDLQLRAGVLTGETSVGPGGNEQGLVVGDLVNTASRLQSIADPGTVFIGEPTHRLVQHVIDCSPAGPRDVKGKQDSVQVFRADRVIAGHGGRRRAESVEPPFVGREDELRLLKDQLHAAAREQRARLISIVGEAGIGKSRLVWELFKYIDGLPEDTYWHAGRSPAYGDGLTLWSIGEMVRRRTGIAVTDEASKSEMKLRTALAEYIRDEGERRWLEPWLAGLLGVRDMPEGDRSELFSALRTLFQRVAELGQTVLVFEDLHWADDGTLDFISELVERSANHPIVVVTLARPDLLERRPGWGAGRRATAALRLSPLSADSMQEMVTGMAPGMPEDAVAEIVARAAGIPLYAVEFVRMLLASGDVVREGDRFRVTGSLDGLSIPDSLQAVVGARLDRLDAQERSLVQDAAVLGQSFTLEGLEVLRGVESEALSASLRPLIEREIFEFNDDPRSPERGQYQFVQSVVREVAYGRLSRDDRHTAHLKVADYFESLDDPELAIAVASHLKAAREVAAPDAADELITRALAALDRAAERTADLHSYAQALALCNEAIALAPHDAARVSFWERAIVANRFLADIDGAVAFAEQARQFHESVGDREGTMRAVRLGVSALASAFRSDEAIAIIEPVFAALGGDESDEAARVMAEAGRAFMLVQRSDEAIAACDRALSLAERRAMTPTVIDAIITKATAIGNLHRPQEAMVLLRGAVELAAEHELLALQGRALNNLTVILANMSDRAAMEASEDLRSILHRLGDIAWQYQYASILSDWEIAEGRPERALEIASVFSEEGTPEFFAPIGPFREATVALLRGDVGRADDAYAGNAFWEGTSDPQLRYSVDLGVADIDLMVGRWESAHDHAARADERFGETTIRRIRVQAEAAALSGSRERIAEVLAFTKASPFVGPAIDAWTSFLSGALAALDGEIDDAAVQFTQAIDGLKKIAPRINIATAQLAAALLVGDRHPMAFTAAGEVESFIADSGYELLRSHFGDALSALRPDVA